MGAWSREARHRVSEEMRRRAEQTRCPECGRSAALVMRFDGRNWRYVCQWKARGKCPKNEGEK